MSSYRLVWDDYCSWLLESVKPEFGKKIDEDFPAENSLGGLDKTSAWLKAIETGDRKYIRSDYKESLNTQALIDAAIKSQSSNNMELAEKI